ncbi:MAG: hypothetical protein ABIR34_13535 [Marmoricola sp.]
MSAFGDRAARGQLRFALGELEERPRPVLELPRATEKPRRGSQVV